MSPPSPDPSPATPPPAPGPWRRFAGRHLHDYNRAATSLWLAYAAGGALCAGLSLHAVATLAWVAIAQVAVGIAFVALTACFPIHIPRTKYSIGVADVFVFSLLALYGPGAAALAAGAEGAVGAWRSSKRLTSRVSTPAVAVSAMWLSGCLAVGVEALVLGLGWNAGPARLVAMTLAALPYFAGTTLPLLKMMAVKNRQVFALRQWAEGYAWFAGVILLSALIAGVLALNASQFGLQVIVVAGAATGAAVGLINVSLHRNEAERQRQEEQLVEAQREAVLNEQRFTAAFTHAGIGMAIVRRDGLIVQANRALGALLGCNPEAVAGQAILELLRAGDAELFNRRLAAQMLSADAAAEPFCMELRCQARGSDLWVSIHCSRLADPSGQLDGLIYQLHDITSRRSAERQLQYVAYHDAVTDLANRNCFHERLAIALEGSLVHGESGFAVLFLDLDRFKMVNDSLGHVAGNTVLRRVAERLTAEAGPESLVARLGGDEFAVLVPGLARAAVMDLAQRMLTRLAEPLQINGTELLPCASIGVTFSDLGYAEVEDMLRDADLAMYEAKAGGRHRVVCFEKHMHERVAEKLRLEADLRHAIGEGQLTVVYQPLFELSPQRLIGFEALLRWVHPERGQISPAVFIALAEESGNIAQLTSWVIGEAVGRLASWRSAYPSLQHLNMHVNISGRDLGSDTLPAQVREVLERHTLAARHLTLEITETMLMSNLATSLATLQSLKELGIRLSIDDFGTGYSSLAYLSTLPIDSLKIDRSFVMGMEDRPQNLEIVRAVLVLGRSLGKKVIAEGIETGQQLAALKALGVPVGQGYLLSKPIGAAQVEDLLAQAALPERQDEALESAS